MAPPPSPRKGGKKTQSLKRRRRRNYLPKPASAMGIWPAANDAVIQSLANFSPIHFTCSKMLNHRLSTYQVFLRRTRVLPIFTWLCKVFVLHLRVLSTFSDLRQNFTAPTEYFTIALSGCKLTKTNSFIHSFVRSFVHEYTTADSGTRVSGYKLADRSMNYSVTPHGCFNQPRG